MILSPFSAVGTAAVGFYRSLALLALLSLLVRPVSATLLDRGNGLIYDDVQNITWVQNGSLCLTLNNCINAAPHGQMVWDDAVAWAAGLVFQGFDDWPLPTTTQPDPTCQGQAEFPGFPDQGFARGCTGSEMGHLFNVDGVSEDSSPGPFFNLLNNNWSGTEFAPDTSRAWAFTFIADGDQNFTTKTSTLSAWAVRDGDVLPIPEPGTITMTFSGEDLFNDPNVSFPTTQPTLNGTSLVFGSGTSANEKLLVLPLIPAGTLSGSAPANISISANVTHLGNDFDPHFLIGDGTHIVGAVVADNNEGEFLGITLVDSGDLGTSRTLDSIFVSAFGSAGFPGTGMSFYIQVDFELISGLTIVDASFGSKSGTFDTTSHTSRAIDPTQALSFVFMRDNDIFEQYQINFLTITIPEPIDITLDIKPGSDPNAINPRSQGFVPVAILTTDDFDAITVDPSTVMLENADIRHTSVHFEDVDGDGDADLVLHFQTQDTGIECGDTEALLMGMTLGGKEIEGLDSIKTVGCK